MADPVGPKQDKEVEVRKTREALEQLGLPDDHTPEPRPEGGEEGAATQGPDQASVQTGGPVIKDRLLKSDKQ